MNDTSRKTKIDVLYQASLITIFSIALLGNTIIFYILANPEFCGQSFFRYQFIGTIFDTINVLFIWPFNYQDYFLMSKLKVSCILINYFNGIFTSLSTWLLILSSLDTFLVVKYPTKFKYLNNFKFQMLIILILFISFCALYSFYWIYLTVDTESGCVVVSSINAFYLNLVVVIVALVIPFLLKFIITILTFLWLRKNQINGNNFKRAKKLFKISVGLDFLFLISNLPVCIFFLVNNLSVK
jgi:hypothetical protein